MLITGMVAPVFSTVALGVFAREAGPQALAYVLTGNIVLALMFEIQSKVGGNFAFMRAMGTLDYFASLPIRRPALILATVISFLILSLPALLVTAGFGVLFLGVPLRPHPLLAVVIPLLALPLSAIGALIGASARTPEEATALLNLSTFLLLALGPVVIPPERLPEILVQMGALSPAVHAASALRQTLIGPLTPALAGDLAFLAAAGVLIFWLAGKRMDWRSRG